jgi:photosystem II stability/assembly factor-like uncharacterized protein
MKLYVGTRKGLFVVTERGVGKPHFLGDPVSMVLPDRDGTLYTALNLGHFGVKLHRSENGGKSWQEVAAPEYPPQPKDSQDKTPWKLVQLWSLESDGQRLWAGTIPGGLFTSEDRGKSWQLVQSLWNRLERLEWGGGGYDYAGIDSIAIDPKDPRRVTVAVSTGGAWQTRDGGRSWAICAQGMYAEYMPPERKFEQNAQDVHRLVLCPAQPDVMWAQHHNGVFRTTDGAKTWHEVATIKPSKFGFAVAVHPRDPDLAWFVPAVKDERRVPVDAKLVVARTRDGGKSFQVLRKGLPQKHAYDLVYRHCLDVDRTGKRLAFGSTTGNLWLSANQGDSWRCLSTHLPPIHCVRFG